MKSIPLVQLILLPIVLTPVGCGRDAPAPPIEPRPAPASADAIPVGPLSGKIGGHDFALKNARYFVDERHGYEKLQIVLGSVESKDECAELGSQHPTSVWLRRKGADFPKPETLRFSSKEPTDWQAHYDLYEDGLWVGNGTHAALLVLSSTEVDRKLHGELSVCFGDATGSCVAGSFDARYCPVRIDQPVRGASALEQMPSPPGGENPPPG